MAYSQETKLATGLNNRFSFTFSGLGRGYISRDDIHVYINDVEVGKTFEAGTDNVLIVDGPVLAAGTKVLIRRITPKDKPIVDWQDTGLLREDILDTANEQLLYSLHEVLDGYGLTDVQVDINMNGNKITGVGVDLNDPSSLITVGGVGTYRDDSIAAAQAAAQSATNAHSEYQNAQTERILTEAQRGLAQQAAVEAQASAGSASSSAVAAAAARDATVAALDGVNTDITALKKKGKYTALNTPPSGTQALAAGTITNLTTTEAPTGTLGAVKSGSLLALVIPESGEYAVSIQIPVSSAAVTTFYVYLYKNGALLSRRISNTVGGQWSTGTLLLSSTFVAGDIIDVRVQTGLAGTVLNSDGALIITRL